MSRAMSQEQKFEMMTEAPIPGLIGRLAVPTIISMLVTAFYNMADTFFVGKIDSNSATGAVGVVFSLMAIIQAVGFFFGHGSGNYISRQLGRQKPPDRQKKWPPPACSWPFPGDPSAGPGPDLPDPLARLLGSTDTILPYARDYLRFILLGAPVYDRLLVLNNQLRFQGSAVYAMIGITSGGVLNVGLDPLFIFVFDLGIAGAASPPL